MDMQRPTYPAVGTLASRALALLLKGKKFTHGDFLAHAGTYRLSGYIHELRDAGWPIVTVEREKPTSDPRRRVATVGEYSLPVDVIQYAGERGEKFVESVGMWEAWVTVGAVGAAPAVEKANVSTQTSRKSNRKRGR